MTSQTATTTYDPNPAKTIRTRLKSELGLTSKDVSVRKLSGGGGARLVVRTSDVDILEIERVAKDSERIDRCEITGEILSGGNTFVFVEWDDDLLRAMTPALDPEELSDVGNYVRLGRVDIAHDDLHLFRVYVNGTTEEEDEEIEQRLRDGGARHFEFYDVEGVRRGIATMSLVAGVDLAAATGE